MKTTVTENTRVFLVGSGIASLSSAVLLIRDAGFNPENIMILEQNSVIGGALDGAGDAEKGYVIRGGRMHEEQYRCYWDVLSGIPSYDDPDVSVTEETMEFNRRFVSHAQARLLRNGEKMDLSSYQLSRREQFRMMELLFTP